MTGLELPVWSYKVDPKFVAASAGPMCLKGNKVASKASFHQNHFGGDGALLWGRISGSHLGEASIVQQAQR